MSNFVLEKNKINTIALTLRERQLLVSPYYLFEFKSRFINDEYRYCNADNISPITMRIDIFSLEEKQNPINADGEIELNEGQWLYKVYESNVKTLNPAQTTGRILQTGMCIVKK